MSEFMVGLQLTLGIVTALLALYVAWNVFRTATFLFRIGVGFWRLRAKAQQELLAEELWAKRQREWETQAKLHAKKLLDAVPELEEYRQMVLHTPYVRGGGNAKRTRILGKIRELVKSHWVVTGAEIRWRNEVLKQLRTSWENTHESR